MLRSLKLLAVGTLAILPVTAEAQQNCAPRAAVLEHLSAKFGESRKMIGMGPEGRVFELFASIETGSWTITITLPSGLTCLVASGESYEALSDAPAATGEAS